MKRFLKSNRVCAVSGLVLTLVFGGAIANAGEPKVATDSSAPIAIAPATNSPWSNILMIGASASAGFTLSEPFGGPKTHQLHLNGYVDAALAAPHQPVRSVASALFFLQPDMIARRQINDALQSKPSLVLGLDFLFWFCYGEIQTNETRLARFEKGLKLLEEIPCPLVVGDIPDASAAVNGILAPTQIPSVEIMTAANRRLKAWAAGRKQVVLVSLSDFMRTAMADEPISLHHQTFPQGTTRAFLQDDKLHPSPLGCSVLALAIMDALQKSEPDVFAAPVRWDSAEVLRIGRAESSTTNKPPVKVATPVGGASSKALKD